MMDYVRVKLEHEWQLEQARNAKGGKKAQSIGKEPRLELHYPFDYVMMEWQEWRVTGKYWDSHLPPNLRDANLRADVTALNRRMEWLEAKARVDGVGAPKTPGPDEDPFAQFRRGREKMTAAKVAEIEAKRARRK